MKKSILPLVIISIAGCNSEKKTGIEGSNNSNNTVIIADHVTIPSTPVTTLTPNTESGKYHFDFSITAEGVGGIKFGESIDEVQQFFKRDANFTFVTDEGARGEGTDSAFPIIYVKDSTNTAIFGIRSGDLKIVDGFEIYSEKFKTYNGIHTGMPIAQLSALYNNNLILYQDAITEQEYFEPFDLQGKNCKLFIYVQIGDNNEASILKSGAVYEKKNNYEQKGKVSYFVFSYDNPLNKYSR